MLVLWTCPKKCIYTFSQTLCPSYWIKYVIKPSNITLLKSLMMHPYLLTKALSSDLCFYLCFNKYFIWCNFLTSKFFQCYTWLQYHFVGINVDQLVMSTSKNLMYDSWSAVSTHNWICKNLNCYQTCKNGAKLKPKHMLKCYTLEWYLIK